MQLASPDLCDLVRGVIADELGLRPEQVQDHHMLRGDALACDELDVLAIAITLEERCGVCIPDEDLDLEMTVASLAALIAAKGGRVPADGAHG